MLKDEEKFVCMICARDHRSSSFPFKNDTSVDNMTCANCKGQHRTTDHECPVLQQQVDFILSKTMNMCQKT